MFELAATELQFVNGNLLAWLFGTIMTVIAGVIGMYYRQQRLLREVYGSDEDDGRDGILRQQKKTQDEIKEQLCALETNVDRQFAELEYQMATRHEETSTVLAKIIENMDDPPEDVELRGRWDDFERAHGDEPKWSKEYYDDRD